MIGPSFYINGKDYQFNLNKSTWQWHITIDYKRTHIRFSKSKGEAIIEFLKAIERLDSRSKSQQGRY